MSLSHRMPPANTGRQGTASAKHSDAPTARVRSARYLVVSASQVGVVAAAVLLGLLAGFEPLLAAAAVLGLAYIALVVTNLPAALALFTILAFVDSLGGGEGGTSFLKLAGVLLVAGWLAAMLRRDTGENFFAAHPKATFTILVFIAWTGATALWADYPGVAVSTTIRFVQQVVLFFIVFAAVTTGRRSLLLLVLAYLVGSSISAVLALADPSAVLVDGDGLERASGGAGDPNTLAALLIPALALSAALLAGRSLPGWARLLIFVGLAIYLAVFLLTLSRGGMLGLAVAVLAALVFGGRWKRHVLALGVVAAAATVCFYVFFADPAAIERAMTPSEGGGSGRMDIWRMGARMVEDNPIGGIGVGHYALVSNQYLVRTGLVEIDDYILLDPKQAHNMYLDVLAETGVVGLLLFTGLLTFSLLSTLRAARLFQLAGDADMEILSRALFVGLLGLLAADFFLSELLSKQLWILLALGPALLRVATRELGDMARPAPLAGSPAIRV